MNQVTGLDVGDDEDYIDACDNAARTLEANRYTGLAPDIREVDTKVDGSASPHLISHERILKAPEGL